MKKKVIMIVAIASALFIGIVASLILIPRMETTKNFTDTSDVLLNPGKGFVDYGTMIYNGAEDYVSIGYHRFNWADIEETEGNINFEKIDQKINSYAKRNKKYAFGIMCVNTSAEKENITPQYVFDKGANYYTAKVKTDTGYFYQKVPDWQDETYLECVNNFVKALGERYNGNENIAFIDILSYGNWGEQHLFHLDIVDYPGTDYKKEKSISAEFFKENYVRPYMEAFPDTLLFNPWGEEDFNEVYEELIDEGVSLRRDGIVKYTNGLDELAKCYGKLPVVFEYAGNYKDYIPDREKEFNEELEKAIAIAKPTYIELDEDWFKNNKEYCAELANRMGYYFRLKQVKYQKNIKFGKETKITFTFKNDGIAPIYEKCFVYVGLLNENGEVVQKVLTSLDPKTWESGKTCKQTVKVKFDGIEEGKYSLAVGLFQNKSSENPTYLLGSKCEMQNNWYIMGNVNIAKK